MDVFDSLLNKMKVSMADEDDFDDDDYEEDDEPRNARSIFRSSKKNNAEEYNEDEDEEDEPVQSSKYYGANKASQQSRRAETAARPQKKNTPRKVGKVMAMKSTERLAEVTVKVPHSEDDATECVELLLQGNAVLLNLEGLGVDHAQRVIDFVSGACYATQGNFQKVSNKLFIASPREVILSGDFLENLGDGFTMPSFDING